MLPLAASRQYHILICVAHLNFWFSGSCHRIWIIIKNKIGLGDIPSLKAGRSTLCITSGGAVTICMQAIASRQVCQRLVLQDFGAKVYGGSVLIRSHYVFIMAASLARSQCNTRATSVYHVYIEESSQ